MRKYLTAVLVPVLLTVVVIFATSGLLKRRNERIVQELTTACIDHGLSPSWSIEPGLLTSHVKFSCVAQTSTR